MKDLVLLTKDEQKKVLQNLDQKEKDSLPTTVSILQKIAGIYINQPDFSEKADLYRFVANVLDDLIKNK
ncbi:MAG: hypothetical protein Q4D25_10030 [Bacteroidales bacterium]|nr:hypothetical protein [Bacteroidales bacterium]